VKKTIYDIAEELNLAPSTISKAINNTGNVSAKTRKRVLDYIKEVGYVPANSARMLRSTRSYTIGVVFSEETNIGLEHTFFSSLLEHFKKYVEKLGYELSFIVTQLGTNKLSYYEWCINKKVDGVYIVVGGYSDYGIIELANKNIPVVSNDILMKGVKTFICDNKQGIDISLDYFRNKSKLNRIGMIAGPLNAKAFKMRYEAFISYFKSIGIDVDPNYICESKSFGFNGGYEACEEMIRKNKVFPEGLIVASDDIAVGVLRCLYDHGIKVPEDVQIIGFDDVNIAKLTTPKLSTIRQDTTLMAETAAANLIRMIEDSEYEVPDITELPVSLVIRETTREK